MANIDKLNQVFSGMSLTVSDIDYASNEICDIYEELCDESDSVRCSSIRVLVHTIDGITKINDGWWHVTGVDEETVSLDYGLLKLILEDQDANGINRIEVLFYDVDGDKNWYIDLEEEEIM